MKKAAILLSLITSTLIHAQDKGHFVSLKAGGGTGNLMYDLTDGSRKGMFGYSVDLGYTYFFNPKWGISTGIGIQKASAEASLEYNESQPSVDTDGDTYEFRTAFANWKEKQEALFIEVPVAGSFQHYFNEKFTLLTTIGGKLSFPVNQTYKVSSGSITTTGYYPQWNLLLEDLPQHGFTTTDPKPTGNLSLKTSFSVFGELGGLYNLNDKYAIYLGGYFSYGLNNSIDASNKPLYDDSATYNSVLASNRTDKVKLLAFGVKIGLRIQLKREKVEEDEE